MDKIRIIERSLRCYIFGWLSLLPIVGFAFGPLALLAYRSVRIEAGREWNPAGRYLKCGAVLACLGLLLYVLLSGLVFISILKSDENEPPISQGRTLLKE